MSDLISRSELIEDIKRRKYIDKPLEEIFETIIDEQPKVGEWIPVSERLPETNGVYNITRTINNLEGENIYYISDSAYFDGTSTWHDDTRVNHRRPYLKNVLAWMPLPEPYRGE